LPAPTPALLLITVATLFLPGIVVALGAGLRVPAAVAAAPLVTYGLTTATSAAATVVSFAWSPWVLAVGAATLGGVLWAVRSRGRTAGPRLLRRPSPGDLLVAAGVAAGSALSMGVFLAGMGGVDRANQDWDYSFHANATRFIADSGDLAPSALRAVNDW